MLKAYYLSFCFISVSNLSWAFNYLSKSLVNDPCPSKVSTGCSLTRDVQAGYKNVTTMLQGCYKFVSCKEVFYMPMTSLIFYMGFCMILMAFLMFLHWSSINC